MARQLRRHLLGFACLAAAGLIGVAAIVDHHWKTERADRLEVAEWYCIHLGTRCGGPSWETVETRWNERQLGYEIAVGVLGAAGIGFFVVRSVRPSR